MQVRCERDGTVFEATPRPYPTKEFQAQENHPLGDQVIDCPTCGRGYMLEADGTWEADRKLTILNMDIERFFEFVVGDYLEVLRSGKLEEGNETEYVEFINGLRKVASMIKMDLKQFDVDGLL